MAKHYQLVVFDWEGTIVENGLGCSIVALTRAAERLHLPTVDLHTARLAVPYGLTNVVRKLFPTISLRQQEDLCIEVQKIMLEISASVPLVAGVEELIRWLHVSGVYIAIATNKSAQGLARVLRLSGLESFIHITRSATEAPAKPCPRMLEEIMDAFAISAQKTLMVGDSASDMEMAKALKVDAVGMDFFQLEESTLRTAGACAVFHNYEQLTQYVKGS